MSIVETRKYKRPSTEVDFFTVTDHLIDTNRDNLLELKQSGLLTVVDTVSDDGLVLTKVKTVESLEALKIGRAHV